MGDSDSALSTLLAAEAVREVLARYCERLDEYDLDGTAATFTDDVVTDYGPGRGGRVEGRVAVRDRIARGQSTFRRTHHQLGQSRIEIEGTTANAVTYVTAWHELWDGSRATVYLRYCDRLERRADEWLIADRRVEASGVVGFEGVEWTWVQRRPPDV